MPSCCERQLRTVQIRCAVAGANWHYVHDVPRKEIAAQLHLSDAAVRNYINHIFKVFELPYDSAQRSERRLQLRAQALAAGYIGDMPARP